MKTRIVCLLVVGVCLLVGADVPGGPQLENSKTRNSPTSSLIARSAAQYKILLANMERMPAERQPKSWKDGKLCVDGLTSWCSGFFPGSLWTLYDLTGDESWRAAAWKFTRCQEKIRHLNGNHDIGFMLMTSVGEACAHAQTDEERQWCEAILADGSAALATRYEPKLGLIRSWGKITDTNDFLVIIDNMMNLELLERTGRDALARHHADMTDAHHFRPDGSAYHVLDYNQKVPGKILEVRAGQGATISGTWSRGQSWAICGFAMMYRETKEARYLRRAIRSAEYAINHPNMPPDGVPYWDYHAAGIPGEERDSSAAAIMACGLLELADHVPQAEGARYRAFAEKQIASLASPVYFAAPGEQGGFLLKHGVGSKPGFIARGRGGEVDVPLNYGDYYFLKAIQKLENSPTRNSKTRNSKTFPTVDARYVPERMDDFCWENEYCGMRAYGPKVSEPRPAGEGLFSSGFDVFNKAVTDVQMAETLIRGVKEKISYHKNNGRGFDNYKVSTARGCGGIGRFDANGWSYPVNWKRQRVLEKTPARAVFELEYEDYTIRGTVQAGTPFVRFDVKAKKACDCAECAGALVGPGLDISAKRLHNGVFKLDVARGFVANFEPETEGHVMTAIILANVQTGKGAPQLAHDPSGCIFLLQDKSEFTYYAGAAWSGMGIFETPEAWFACVENFSKGLQK